jgi:hypothetical protein
MLSAPTHEKGKQEILRFLAWRPAGGFGAGGPMLFDGADFPEFGQVMGYEIRS